MFDSTVFSVIPLAWSLSVEFIFYFFLIILIHILNQILSLKSSLKSSFINLFIKYGLFIFILLLPLPFSIYFTKVSTDIHVLSISSFYIGILLALSHFYIVEKNIKIPIQLSKIFSILAILALVFIFYRIQFDSKPENFLPNTLSPHAFHLQIIKYMVMVSFLFALIMLISFFKDSLFYPIFTFYPLRFIGLVSYEMYLSHVFVFAYIKSSHIAYGHHLTAIISFLLCLFVATLLHFTVSRPFMALSHFSIKQPSIKKPLWMKVLLGLLVMSVIIPVIHWLQLMNIQQFTN